jgi:hypothetical protein
MYRRAINKLIVALIVGIAVFSLYNPVTRAQEGPVISITAPSDISGWTLSPEGPQPHTQGGTLHVTVSGNFSGSWVVTAIDADSSTGGHMTKYDGGYDSGTKLATPLQVQGPGGSVTLPSGGNVVAGNGEVDQDFPITFLQNVAWIDPVGDYRIVVTFTGTIQP